MGHFKAVYMSHKQTKLIFGTSLADFHAHDNKLWKIFGNNEVGHVNTGDRQTPI